MKNKIKSQNIGTQYNSMLKNYTNRIIAEVDSFYNIQAPQIPLWEIHNILWEKLSDLDAYFDTLFSLIFSNDMDGEIMKENKYLSYYANIFGYYFLVLFHKDIGKLIPKDLVHEIGFKYFYLLYKQWASLNSFKKQQNKLNIANTKIQTLLAWRWFQIDIEYISQQKICEFITFLEHSLILPEEKEFYTAIVYYLCNLLIVHNLLWSQHHLSTLDDIPKNPHNNPWSQLYFFSLSLIAQADFILQHEWDYTFWNQIARLHSIVWNNVSLWHLKKIQKSFLYQNYFLPWLIKNESLFQLAIQHEKLFIHEKHIPFQKLFEKLNTKNQTLSFEIWDIFCQNIKKYKRTETQSIDIFESIMKYKKNISFHEWNILFQYISWWYNYESIFDVWFQNLELLQSKTEAEKKELFTQLTHNKNYLQEQEIKKIIDDLSEEIAFLWDDHEAKIEAYNIIKQKNLLNIDELQVQILTLKIKYNFDSIISYFKKIFSNKNENIEEKHIFFDIGKSYFESFCHQDELLTCIFTHTLKDIEIIFEMISKIDFWNDIKKNDFLSFIDICLKKKTYIQNMVFGKKITYEEFVNMIQGKKIQETLEMELKKVYNTELYEFIMHHYQTIFINEEFEKIKLIINIGTKLHENMKEDFILHGDDFSVEDLQHVYEIISLFWFYHINILNFWEYKKIYKKYDAVMYIKNIFTNQILESIINTEELKNIIYQYIESENKNILKDYISQLWKKEINLVSPHKYDHSMREIYANWNTEEKEKFVQWIYLFLIALTNAFHPNHTTSTRNNNFWTGSGSYTYVINNYILKKLLQIPQESNDEYLKRLLSLDIMDILTIQDMNHINGSHELKCLYRACSQCDTLQNTSFFAFLENIESMMSKISWEISLDLWSLQKFYHWLIKNGFKKMKRN